MGLELLEDEEALTEQDRDLLKGYGVEQLAEDLHLFAGWHEALGMDQEAALTEMRSRIREGSPD
jgi:phage tail tube protein FII